MGFCADASNKSCSNNLFAVSRALSLSITPNANHAPMTTAAINPIKLRNGRPILVFSFIFIDMINTHQNLNLVLLMLLLYIPCCKTYQTHLLHQTLLHIVYIVFSLDTCPPVNKFFPPRFFNFQYVPTTITKFALCFASVSVTTIFTYVNHFYPPNYKTFYQNLQLPNLHLQHPRLYFVLYSLAIQYQLYNY